ncbi:MAG: SpoIID/LytB domain-containing protein [Tannerellaceae bacterium]|nr:SpoIID/LytB domain-containing protein [Tannerellaceae bacterium]
MKAPVVNVGILTDTTLSFLLKGNYHDVASGKCFSGEHPVFFHDGKICFRDQLYSRLFFMPTSEKDSFIIKEVTIGVDFHWERKEDQEFQGALNLVACAEGILVINQIDIESYLISVISSEMSATATKEFLKAHAVISRSWLLAQIEKNNWLVRTEEKYQNCYATDEELIRWYDREDHILFDVCADDHCQRYQGITRASTDIVKEVITETRGEILVSEENICDARFSKCCGGVTEKFEYCWEPVPHTYLTALRDSEETTVPDLTQEAEAIRWIQESPNAFCLTNNKAILSQVLNNYDQETTDFYRWETTYSQEELSELICRKSGKDLGDILDLIPLERGTSGRIQKLKIVGSKQTFTIGKELEIRRTLSESHLYSSAFIVEKHNVEDKVPGQFIFKGAGWGHGVGLCQIGAAVMGNKGYTYKEILSHYFKQSEIEKRY